MQYQKDSELTLAEWAQKHSPPKWLGYVMWILIGWWIPK